MIQNSYYIENKGSGQSTVMVKIAPWPIKKVNTTIIGKNVHQQRAEAQ